MSYKRKYSESEVFFNMEKKKHDVQTQSPEKLVNETHMSYT